MRGSCAMGREFCAAAALAMRLERDSRGDNEAQAASYADAGRGCPLRVSQVPSERSSDRCRADLSAAAFETWWPQRCSATPMPIAS
jgi:hypothetical protein